MTGDEWCILRTSGGRTLPLARSLADAKFEVWTPQQTQHRLVRRGRTQVKQKVDVAMMPTFVFARASALPELLQIIRAPVSQHPPFSIFHLAGQRAFVGDREIARLRLAEQHATPKRRRRTLPIGAVIRPDVGAYAGLDGVVTHSDGSYTMVAFGGWMDVKIETFLLTGDDIEQTGTVA